MRLNVISTIVAMVPQQSQYCDHYSREGKGLANCIRFDAEHGNSQIGDKHHPSQYNDLCGREGEGVAISIGPSDDDDNDSDNHNYCPAIDG